MLRKVNSLIYIVYVAPLLLFSGFTGRKILKKLTEEMDDDSDLKYKNLFNVSIVTGIIVLSYHLYKLIM